MRPYAAPPNGVGLNGLLEITVTAGDAWFLESYRFQEAEQAGASDVRTISSRVSGNEAVWRGRPPGLVRESVPMNSARRGGMRNEATALSIGVSPSSDAAIKHPRIAGSQAA